MVTADMKRIGFLSFGHWSPIEGSQARTARESLLQSVELAEATEELGLDGRDGQYLSGTARLLTSANWPPRASLGRGLPTSISAEGYFTFPKAAVGPLKLKDSVLSSSVHLQQVCNV